MGVWGIWRWRLGPGWVGGWGCGCCSLLRSVLMRRCLMWRWFWRLGGRWWWRRRRSGRSRGCWLGCVVVGGVVRGGGGGEVAGAGGAGVAGWADLWWRGCGGECGAVVAGCAGCGGGGGAVDGAVGCWGAVGAAGGGGGGGAGAGALAGGE